MQEGKQKRGRKLGGGPVLEKPNGEQVPERSSSIEAGGEEVRKFSTRKGIAALGKFIEMWEAGIQEQSS